MISTPAAGAFTVLIPRVSKYQQTADEINIACTQLDLPPAFDISDLLDSNNLRITANPTYRFEGFGLVLGFPPKLSFEVHYLPGTEDHVELGRFLAPISLSEIIKPPSVGLPTLTMSVE
ncbi:MAG: hypothetical protein AAFW84_03570 [Cyanobacteria bacterium J06635_15]